MGEVFRAQGFTLLGRSLKIRFKGQMVHTMLVNSTNTNSTTDNSIRYKI